MRSPLRKFPADARALVPAALLCVIACRDERAVLVLSGGSDAGRTDADVATGLRVVVSPNKVIRQISPLIYGFHLPDGPSIQAVDYTGLRPTLLRVPGFRPTTYNWELNASNGGVSWCSENASAIGPAQPLGFVDAAAETAEQLGATLVIPVPIGTHVAGDTKVSALPLRSADVTGRSPMLTLPALSVSLLHSPSR